MLKKLPERSAENWWRARFQIFQIAGKDHWRLRFTSGCWKRGAGRNYRLERMFANVLSGGFSTTYKPQTCSSTTA